MMYLSGIAFLFIASTVIAIPFAMLVQRKAIFLSVCLATLILKTWAYFAIGGFDLGFLMIQIIIGLCAAVAVNFGVDRVRERIVKPT